MTDKQKEAIEYFKKRIDICMENANICDDNDFDEEATYLRKEQILIETILNLLQTQQAEIEHQKEKRENQKKELSILNEKQKEFNKLVNTVKSYKGQFKRQQAEIEKKDKQIEQYQNMLATNDMLHVLECEKKDKMIDLMIKVMIDSGICDYFIKQNCKHYAGENKKLCDVCIKEYFERKSENGR